MRETLGENQRRQLSSAWQLRHLLQSLCLSGTAIPLWQLLAPHWRVLNSRIDKKRSGGETAIVSRIWPSKASWRGSGSGCGGSEGGKDGRADRKQLAGILHLEAAVFETWRFIHKAQYRCIGKPNSFFPQHTSIFPSHFAFEQPASHPRDSDCIRFNPSLNTICKYFFFFSQSKW